KTEVQAEQGILEGTFSLLPIQDWFFDKVRNKELSNPNHWNQSFIVKVPELDIKRLQAVIPVLAEHHDILRVKYIRDAKERHTQAYCGIDTSESKFNNHELKILEVSK